MAGLTAAQVPRLKLKWAFGFPGDVAADAQPTVVGGRVFVGSQSGNVYALSAETGCVHWFFPASASVRAAVTVGRVETNAGLVDAAFIGDTMFAPDYGTARCDFPGGDARALYRSIQRILSLPAETRAEVALECADVLLFLLRLCDKLDIDLYAAAERKIAINAVKYPADRVRGSARKYTEYED